MGDGRLFVDDRPESVKVEPREYRTSHQRIAECLSYLTFEGRGRVVVQVRLGHKSQEC